jgi:hypothetical protein
MARRNQNTFLKRQKEMERVRKAKEKMARRQGKVLTEEVPSWAPKIATSQEPDGATVAEESSEASSEASSEETAKEPDGEGAVDTSPDL